MKLSKQLGVSIRKTDEIIKSATCILTAEEMSPHVVFQVLEGTAMSMFFFFDVHICGCVTPLWP